MKTESVCPYKTLGIDISKDSLDACFLPANTKMHESNDEYGIAKLIAFAKEQAVNMVVVEASGGYEVALAASFSIEKLPIVIVNPKRIRDFAKALGILAKTDEIDAEVIALFGDKIRPEIRVLPEEKYSLLSQLIVRRRQVIDMLIAERNHLSSSWGVVQKAVAKHVTWLEGCLTKVEAQIKDEIDNNSSWKMKKDLLESVKGVGPVLTVTLIASLPELGTVSKKTIAALVGVCPFNRDSGRFKGKRTIWGGRPDVRNVLYMATRSACQHNPIIRTFYNRLRSKGKPDKVAITACMHKLLIILNAMLKTNTEWRPCIAA